MIRSFSPSFLTFMNERPTLEFILPASKSRVICYSYLTIRESRELKKLTYQTLKVSVDTKEKKADIDKFDATFQIDAEDMAFRFLIKEAYEPNGTKAEDAISYLEALSSADADFLFSKIDDISNASVMTPEVKKN